MPGFSSLLATYDCKILSSFSMSCPKYARYSEVSRCVDMIVTLSYNIVQLLCTYNVIGRDGFRSSLACPAVIACELLGRLTSSSSAPSLLPPPSLPPSACTSPSSPSQPLSCPGATAGCAWICPGMGCRGEMAPRSQHWRCADLRLAPGEAACMMHPGSYWANGNTSAPEHRVIYC